MNKGNRKEHLRSLENEERTMIFYEAPHKLMRTLNDFLAVFGDRQIAVCRELTKKYEEVKRGTISEIISYFEEKPIKGEFVLVVDGAPKEEVVYEMSVQEHVLSLMEKGTDKKDAISIVAKERGIPKKEVYKTMINN